FVVLNKSITKQDTKFVDREPAIEYAWNVTVKRYEAQLSSDTHQRSHPVMVIAAGPGVGKSRLLLELLHAFQSRRPKGDIAEKLHSLLKSHVISVIVTFGNGKKPNFRSEVPEFMLSTRILHSVFAPKVDLST